MSDWMALDLTIKTHIYHCEALVSTIEVIGTVGLLIFVGYTVLQRFWWFC